MLELKCGDRVEVKEGEHKGAVGIVRRVIEIKKVNVQVGFIGKFKTLPAEFLEKVGSNNAELTALSNAAPQSILVDAPLGEIGE